MCAGTWQAEYKLKADTVPQCIHDLLDDLEKIKKAFPTEQEQPGKKGKANPNDSNKRKMVLIQGTHPQEASQGCEALHIVQEARGHACNSQYIRLL
jgi:hypothetical protein